MDGVKLLKLIRKQNLQKLKSDSVLRGADAQAVWKEVHKVYDKAKVQKGIETLNIMFDINFISM